jgi:hypothetical protein
VANASFRTLAVGQLEDTSELKALEALAVQVGKEGGRSRWIARSRPHTSPIPTYMYRWVPRSAWCCAKEEEEE